MKTSLRIIAFLLAFAALTAIGAPEKQTFNPDEALGFLETLSTIDLQKPDLNLLATLFKARNAVGLGRSFVEDVEVFVAAGVVAAGRSDLYLKSIKPACTEMSIASFEKVMTEPCPECQEGNVSVKCPRCLGHGRCIPCKGNGFVGTPVRDLEGNIRRVLCSRCKGTGDCQLCNGSGLASKKCPKCNGHGKQINKENAKRHLRGYALSVMYTLCKGADDNALPDIVKNGFQKARETAEAKFKILREVREEEEVEAREEQERKEQAERERKEREEKAERERKEKEEKAERERKEREEREAFEAEQRAKGLVKYGDRWLTPEEREKAQREDVETVKKIVNEVLETNKRGDVDYRYWEDTILISKLYAPRSWEIVNVNAWSDTASVTARVDSSTKGGIQITKLWVYTLSRKSGTWKITNLFDKD